MYGTLEFWDPDPVLRQLRAIETTLRWSRLPEDVRRLRAQGFKEIREARNAAIFAHGLATVLGSKVLFAPTEKADFDFVVGWVADGEQQHQGVQLKELVPVELNADQSLQAELDKMARKYSKTDTILAILLNRSLEPTTLSLERVPFREVWLFAQTSPDGMRWMLEGDLKTGASRFAFTYPG